MQMALGGPPQQGRADPSVILVGNLREFGFDRVSGRRSQLCISIGPKSLVGAMNRSIRGALRPQATKHGHIHSRSDFRVETAYCHFFIVR